MPKGLGDVKNVNTHMTDGCDTVTCKHQNISGHITICAQIIPLGPP